MLQQVLDIDRILHEQQLGLEWRAPETKLLQRRELASYKAAMELLKDAPKREATPNLFEAVKEERSQQVQDKKFLQHILFTIADKAEFLVENQLLDLIEPYSEEQKTLVRLDSVFQVLGVQNPNDVDALHEFFLPYAECKMCSQSPSDSSDCDHTHELLVEPTSVLKALRDFTKARSQEQKPNEKTYGELVDNRLASASKPTLSRMLSTDDVELYWSRFNEIFTPHNEKLWTAMEHGLTQYLDVLKQREKLDNECEFLRQQNTELNRLLEKYVAGPASPHPNIQFGYFNNK
jgi:dynein regulatry complex protein 1